MHGYICFKSMASWLHVYIQRQHHWYPCINKSVGLGRYSKDSRYIRLQLGYMYLAIYLMFHANFGQKPVHVNEQNANFMFLIFSPHCMLVL